MQRLIDLYTDTFGRQPQTVEGIGAAGSNRRYYRLATRARQESAPTGGRDRSQPLQVVGAIGTSREENDAFVYMSRHFYSKQLPVPRVLAVSADGMCYLQDDLGRTSLFDALRKGREAGGHYDSSETELIRRTIRALPRLQTTGAQDFDWDKCYPQPAFDEQTVMFDLNYFKYCFLKPMGPDFNELKLEADFRHFAKELTTDTAQGFMYRDFQARNVMLDSDGYPHFIDFQGGRKGPFYYDVASFLWQAAARYPHELRRAMAKEYYDALKLYTDAPAPDHFGQQLALFALFRTLQVLGAYGYRGCFERKQHFIDSIPPALGNLCELLQHNSFPYPYMTDLLQRLATAGADSSRAHTRDRQPRATSTQSCARPRHSQPPTSDNQPSPSLVVTIISFSYKKGIPEDTSGNGGGYIFDCRATNNPGRYDKYKQMTGLDEPVIRFLEDDGGITTFLDNVYRLADTHVERYIERGFTHLMFAFGCTGGQHRSVYAAQHLAEHLNNKYGVEVHLCHREQGIELTLRVKS